LSQAVRGRVTSEHDSPEDSFLYIYFLGGIYHNDSTTTNTGSQGTCRTNWPGSNCHAFLPKGELFFGWKAFIYFSYYQVWSLSLSLAEILAIFASVHPSSNISRVVSALLVRSASSTPSEIRLTWAFIFGWICTMSGAYIRRSCYQTLGTMFTFELSLRKNHQLVTSGPYSIVRHPSYIGGALALLGALACYTSPGSWFIECSGLFPPSWAGPIVFSCWFIAGSTGLLVISPRLKKEDAMLKKQFGSQWDAWAADVPYRLIPGVY
jgi:protein-S-isoprenylcysteine O-methyltransferase Ste14